MLQKIISIFRKPPPPVDEKAALNKYLIDLEVRQVYLKFLKTRFKRLVDWDNRMVYDPKSKKQIKYSKFGSFKEPMMPALGFECSECEILQGVDHYLIGRKNFCEPCAIKWINQSIERVDDGGNS